MLHCLCGNMVAIQKDEFYGGGELVGTMRLGPRFLYDDGSKTKGDRE